MRLRGHQLKYFFLNIGYTKNFILSVIKLKLMSYFWYAKGFLVHMPSGVCSFWWLLC